MKSRNVENRKMEYCLYHHSNSHLNEYCYQNQSELDTFHDKKMWCHYHKSQSHSDDETGTTREMITVILPLTIKIKV